MKGFILFRFGLWFLFFVVCSLYPKHSLATSGFPSKIKSQLGLGESPSCALCHTGNVTGKGTVGTPVGRYLVSRGLVAGDSSSLASALSAEEAETQDSDGDGTSDIDELKAGTDPNVGKDGISSSGPSYGCANISAKGVSAPFYSMIVIFLFGWLARGRRKVLSNDA